jgi:hypothetical protein
LPRPDRERRNIQDTGLAVAARGLRAAPSTPVTNASRAALHNISAAAAHESTNRLIDSEFNLRFHSFIC